RQVALRHRRDRLRDLRRRAQEVVDQHVEGGLHLAPCPAGQVELGALACAAFAADDLADALELAGDLPVGFDDLVERLRDLAVDPRPVAWEVDREVSRAHVLERAEELPLVERGGGWRRKGDGGGATVRGGSLHGASEMFDPARAGDDIPPWRGGL